MKNKHFVTCRGISFIILFVASALSVNAQVMWNLKGGIMQRSFYDHNTIWDSYDPEKRLDWMAGLEMEIPLSDRLNLETGVLYKNHNSLVKNDFEYDYYDDWFEPDSHLELPLRLAYKRPLGEHFSLHMGVGPYASYAIGEDLGKKWHNNLHVGLQPSIAIHWACLSLGATYNIPCFYKGYKDENKPVVMATLGIRFKSHVWKYVGVTLLTIASVGAAAGYALDAANSSSYSSSSYSSVGSSYNRSYSSSSNSSGSSMSEQNAYNSDKRTYANYDSMLSAYFAGNRSATLSEVRQWQSAMRQLRTKWESKGKSFPKSTNENR